MAELGVAAIGGLTRQIAAAKAQGIVSLTTREMFAGHLAAVKLLIPLVALLDPEAQLCVLAYFESTADFILLNSPPAGDAARLHQPSPPAAAALPMRLVA